MEKGALIILLVSAVVLIIAIGILGITQLTGAVILGKCWHTDMLDKTTQTQLRQNGCVITELTDGLRICCPYGKCPQVSGIECS
jgi:hypothetical protein